MASKCSCNAKHQKPQYGCGCKPFIGQLPSGSPLPDAEALSDEMIKELDDDVDLDMLMVAVTNNDSSMLKRLLSSGDFDLGEALIIAATQPHAGEIMEILLDGGAPLHYSKHAPLRSAVLAAEPENTLFLIRHGCPVTPELLADAVATRNANIVKVLLNEGADPNARVNDRLPIETAVLDNQWHLVKILMDRTDPALIKGHAAEKIREHYADSFHKANMNGGTFVSIENMEDILGQIRRQQVNLHQAIANKDPDLFLRKLKRGKFTIEDLLEDNVYLSVGASGSVDLMKVLLNYKDTGGKKIKASQIPSSALDAIVLSKNPDLIQFVFNQFTDIDGDRIRVEQLDQKTLLTAVMGGPQMLKTILEWRDKNGRGFTVNDIINTGLLEKLIERGDTQSLAFLMNQFADYNGKRLNIQSLLSNNLGPLRALVGTNNPQAHDIFRQYSDQAGQKLQAHHYSQAAAMKERQPGPVGPAISPPAFQKLVSRTTAEPVAEQKTAMVKNLASVIETHGHELSEAISDSVTQNIENMMSKGVRFSAKLDSGTELAPGTIDIPNLKPTPTATPSVTPTATPSVTPAATPTVTPTVTPTATPTATPSVTPTATPSVTPTATPITVNVEFGSQPTPSVTPFSPAPIVSQSPGYPVQETTPSPLPIRSGADLDKLLHEASQAGAEAAFKAQAQMMEQILQRQQPPQKVAGYQQALSGIKSFISQVDPLRVAQSITADPETLGQMMQGNIQAGDVGTLLSRYAGDQPTDQTSKWAQVAGKFLAAAPKRSEASSSLETQKVPGVEDIPTLRPAATPTVVRTQMPSKSIDTFDEQVQAAFEDLRKYPNAQIKVLAKKMEIRDCEHEPHDALCREIARKIIYVHSDTLPSTDRAKCSRYTKKLSSEELDTVREKIYKEFRKYKDSVGQMSSKQLQKLFQRYDEVCFDGDIQKYMADAKYTLQFKTSGEETFTTEGICTHKVCDYTVTIPTEYFKNVKDVTIVAGHPCKDQLECLLRVIEHELVHLIIFMFCGDPFVTDQHGPLFMNMVRDLFGHTDHRHYIF